MDCQLDISSVNNFLHAISKPARLLAEPAVGRATSHCFDRVPKTVVGLMMQYLFPARRAGEPPLYRFMRVQLLQSRQSSNPAACELLYPGHSEDALEDKRWKNEIDTAYRQAQKSSAMNLFAEFWRNPEYFPQFSLCEVFRYFAPSPAFNKMPCMTFLQRFTHTQALNSHYGFLYLGKDAAIKHDLASLVSQHPALRTLLADPMLQSYVKRRMTHIKQHVGLEGMLEQYPLFSVEISMKVCFVARGVTTASTIYYLYRVVCVVLKAIACVVRECVPYLVCAFVNVAVMMAGYMILRKIVKRTLLAPDMLSKIYAASEPLFRLFALLFSLGLLNIPFYKHATRPYNTFPMRMQSIFYTANRELGVIRAMRDNQMENRMLIAQFLLLRRT